jgi:hypothetical protein
MENPAAVALRERIMKLTMTWIGFRKFSQFIKHRV